jgi:glycosyltransferase involved in cell wall biosynthesis
MMRPEAAIYVGLARMGHAIEIMTYGESTLCEFFESNGVIVNKWHPNSQFDPKAVQSIRNRLIDGKFDILQLYNSKAYWNGLRAARHLAVKVVLYRGYEGNLEWFQPSLYWRYFHPRVDAIICNSQGVAEAFQRQMPFIKWSNKLVTINKGHDLSWYSEVKAADLSVFGVPPDAFVFTCIAHARPMKGIKYLLKAMQLLPEGLNIYLLLVGKSLQTPEMQKIAETSAYARRIIFTGVQPNPVEIDKASNAFVLASIYGESITKGVIEAMAVGTAPIITDIPGNRNLVVDEQSGLVVPPRNPQALAQAMLRLYQSPELLERLGAAAAERISSHLNSAQTVEEFDKFYQALHRGAPYLPRPNVM